MGTTQLADPLPSPPSSFERQRLIYVYLKMHNCHLWRSIPHLKSRLLCCRLFRLENQSNTAHGIQSAESDVFEISHDLFRSNSPQSLARLNPDVSRKFLYIKASGVSRIFNLMANWLLPCSRIACSRSCSYWSLLQFSLFSSSSFIGVISFPISSLDFSTMIFSFRFGQGRADSIRSARSL